MLMAGEEETIAHFRWRSSEYLRVGGGMKVLSTINDLSKGIDICIANVTCKLVMNCYYKMIMNQSWQHWEIWLFLLHTFNPKSAILCKTFICDGVRILLEISNQVEDTNLLFNKNVEIIPKQNLTKRTKKWKKKFYLVKAFQIVYKFHFREGLLPSA